MRLKVGLIAVALGCRKRACGTVEVGGGSGKIGSVRCSRPVVAFGGGVVVVVAVLQTARPKGERVRR